MADDHAPRHADAFDLDSDEGLEAYLTDLHARRGVPERLRYPETDEDYDRMVAEAKSGGYISGEAVLAWMRSWGSDNELPPPKCGD